MSRVDPDVLGIPSKGARPERLQCELHRAGRAAAWISLRGKLDLATAGQFARAFEDARASALLIVVDLRQLTFADRAGLGTIVDADARARATGHRIVLIRSPQTADHLSALTGFADRLRIVDLSPNLHGA